MPRKIKKEKLESVPTNANTTIPEKKFSFEKWIAIGNLILTAVVGIGIAIYLQIRTQDFQAELQRRSEEFQKQIIEIQNQTQNANIQISHQNHSGSGHFIDIHNLGPAIAKNIRVAFCIESINPVWEKNLVDVNQFEFAKYTNPSFRLSRENTSSSCGYSFSNNANNASLISIDLLPPNESFGVSIRLSKDVELHDVETDVNAFLLIPTTLAEKVNSTEVRLDIFAMSEAHDDSFSIATFQANASCDNCIVTTDGETVGMWTTSERRPYYYQAPILGESSEYIKTGYTTKIKHRLPLDLSFPSMNLYLLANLEGSISTDLQQNLIIHYTPISEDSFHSREP